MDSLERIMGMAARQGTLKATDVAAKLKMTRQYASRLLATLAQEGKLMKIGSTRGAKYVLPTLVDSLNARVSWKLHNEGIREHEVLEGLERRAQFLQMFPENVRSIFSYAFSEMLNNAIEHSRSKNIEVVVEKDGKNLTFYVKDLGIGVFQNIMQKKGLHTPLEAIQDLLKGKMTTEPQSHSGEGIFFTSKIADEFSLESFGDRLRVSSVIDDVSVHKERARKKGTRVRFQIALDTKKHLSDVFREFQSDAAEYAFDKTEIQVRLYTMGTVHVSRSQARRVLAGLEKFRLVILDFDKVPIVGQAFADEIFRVFKNAHPEIEIRPINMNKTSRFMVGRVAKE